MKFIILAAFIIGCSSLNLKAQPAKKISEDIIHLHIENGYIHGAIVGYLDQKNSFEDIFYLGSISGNFQMVPSATDLYEIGSLSKTFTGIILASMVLDGSVKLDDPIKLYLPKLSKSVVGNITLKELSTHMSGLPRLPDNLKPKNPYDPYADYTEKMLLDFLMSIKKLNKPQIFSWDNYSNLGVGLLGYILQIQSQLSYDQLLEKYITVPLNMPSTKSEISSTDQRYLTGFDPILSVTSHWYLPKVFVGAGGIKSNALDMMNYLRANLNPDSTSIATAIRLAQTVQVKASDESMIGLGWGISKKGDQTFIGHNGGTGGFRSNMQMNVTLKKGVYTLTNSANELQCLAGNLLSEAKCEPDFGFQLTHQDIDNLVGKYTNAENKLTIVIYKVGKQIFYEVPNQEKGRMKALSQYKFDIATIATIEFKDPQNLNEFHFMQGEFKAVFQKER